MPRLWVVVLSALEGCDPYSLAYMLSKRMNDSTAQYVAFEGKEGSRLLHQPIGCLCMLRVGACFSAP